jgi:hypothetical protein
VSDRAGAAQALKLAAAQYGWVLVCGCGRADIADDGSCAACDDDPRLAALQEEIDRLLARVAELIVSVPCTTCGAVPGQRCRTSSGRVPAPVHEARQNAAWALPAEDGRSMKEIWIERLSQWRLREKRKWTPLATDYADPEPHAFRAEPLPSWLPPSPRCVVCGLPKAAHDLPEL